MLAAGHQAPFSECVPAVALSICLLLQYVQYRCDHLDRQVKWLGCSLLQMRCVCDMRALHNVCGRAEPRGHTARVLRLQQRPFWRLRLNLISIGSWLWALHRVRQGCVVDDGS